MNYDQLKNILKENLAQETFVYAVVSSPRVKSPTESFKLLARPLEIKKNVVYQVSEYKGQKVFHHNLTPEACLDFLYEHIIHSFKQAILYTGQADYHLLVNRKKEVTILKKAATKASLPLLHNRKKHYVLQEGIPIDFLIKLGVMTPEGKIFPKKSDKFRQINRFLEMVQDILPALNKEKKIHIIDFGCGKAYLTFALYYYLHEQQGYVIEIQGLDLKEDVVKHCQEIAHDLNYHALHFSLGDIKQYHSDQKVDMVVTLHACDTATDAAIGKALQWDAEVILTVPCCQHELFSQIKSEPLKPLLKHGILKERFSALVTDASRAQLLEIKGYDTQVLEFIDLEHTPKNLLIRAVKRKHLKNSSELLNEYQIFKKHLSINPSLENFLI